jgi:hypothetical protein
MLRDRPLRTSRVKRSAARRTSSSSGVLTRATSRVGAGAGTTGTLTRTGVARCSAGGVLTGAAAGAVTTAGARSATRVSATRGGASVGGRGGAARSAMVVGAGRVSGGRAAAASAGVVAGRVTAALATTRGAGVGVGARTMRSIACIDLPPASATMRTRPGRRAETIPVARSTAATLALVLVNSIRFGMARPVILSRTVPRSCNSSPGRSESETSRAMLRTGSGAGARGAAIEGVGADATGRLGALAAGAAAAGAAAILVCAAGGVLGTTVDAATTGFSAVGSSDGGTTAGIAGSGPGTGTAAVGTAATVFAARVAGARSSERLRALADSAMVDIADSASASWASDGAASSAELNQRAPSSAAEPTVMPPAMRSGESRRRTKSSLSAGFPGRISGVRSTSRHTPTLAPQRAQVARSSLSCAEQAGQVAKKTEVGTPSGGAVGETVLGSPAVSGRAGERST